MNPHLLITGGFLLEVKTDRGHTCIADGLLKTATQIIKCTPIALFSFPQSFRLRSSSAISAVNRSLVVRTLWRLSFTNSDRTSTGILFFLILP